jgi:hypothetical protein
MNLPPSIHTKTLLTKTEKVTSLQQMPNFKSASNRAKIKSLRVKKATIQDQYTRFFVPAPSPLWVHDDEGFSLDQPSPYKWVETETTYGIDTTLCPISNA